MKELALIPFEGVVSATTIGPLRERSKDHDDRWPVAIRSLTMQRSRQSLYSTGKRCMSSRKNLMNQFAIKLNFFNILILLLSG
jgi:hypothetical protein